MKYVRRAMNLRINSSHCIPFVEHDTGAQTPNMFPLWHAMRNGNSCTRSHIRIILLVLVALTLVLVIRVAITV